MPYKIRLIFILSVIYSLAATSTLYAEKLLTAPPIVIPLPVWQIPPSTFYFSLNYICKNSTGNGCSLLSGLGIPIQYDNVTEVSLNYIGIQDSIDGKSANPAFLWSVTYYSPSNVKMTDNGLTSRADQFYLSFQGLTIGNQLPPYPQIAKEMYSFGYKCADAAEGSGCSFTIYQPNQASPIPAFQYTTYNVTAANMTYVLIPNAPMSDFSMYFYSVSSYGKNQAGQIGITTTQGFFASTTNSFSFVASNMLLN
ncbi:MAG: hypothetical protein ACLPIC_16900 [Rhodoblastus sp.]|uniref:hypothetical protein n=1 Tax=Rhodoblastus sp. TaxID=1962975 RepID=UPI003F9A6F84